MKLLNNWQFRQYFDKKPKIRLKKGSFRLIDNKLQGRRGAQKNRKKCYRGLIYFLGS